MIITPIKTRKVLPGKQTIFDLLDAHLTTLNDKSIIAITSKIISLCEGRAVPVDEADLEELIRQEAEYYLTKEASGPGGHRTIVNHTLISAAGIDASNAAGNYVLLPKNAQQSASQVRAYLQKKHKLKNIGVVITDSKSTPLRLGASGIALGWSGFAAINNYRGKEDLFGRKIKVSRADIAGGLASAAVLVMGEGAEQTPLAVIEDMPFIKFQDRSPTKEELKYMNLSLEEDLFAPLLTSVKWLRGKNKY